MNQLNLSLFIPTFFFVSLTPGMCMTLALTLGMSIGLRRALWMMYGELAGVGLVAATSVIGVAAIMMQYPAFFIVLKYGGGAYLAWLGLLLWRSRGKMAISLDAPASDDCSRAGLALQGFVSAVANPKAWAFFVALLPPFIDNQTPLAPQLSLLLAIILIIEFISLLIYAGGGRTLGGLLQKSGNVRLVNRIAGTLMLGVGVWLALG